MQLQIQRNNLVISCHHKILFSNYVSILHIYDLSVLISFLISGKMKYISFFTACLSLMLLQGLTKSLVKDAINHDKLLLNNYDSG